MNTLREFCLECGSIQPMPATAPTVVQCQYCFSEWEVKRMFSDLYAHKRTDRHLHTCGSGRLIECNSRLYLEEHGC